MNRRQFLEYSAATAGALFLPLNLTTAEPKKKYANDIVALGNTGLQASRLAMGTGTHGVNRRSNQTQKLGVQGVADLLFAAYERGINFWDSADQYGTHPHLKEALKRVPREKVVILTKTHATTAEEMRADIDRFRQEIGTDYLDIVLLHFMTDPNWPTVKQAGMEVLAQMRQDGIVRSHGVSCHTLGALEAAANSDWVQVDLARINPFGARMDDTVEKVVPVLKKMHDQGKSVIGMKIFGAGQLRDKVNECLKYVLRQNYVDAFTIGQENQDEMRDLIQRIPEMSIA
ncbi:aldo/keto reductase [candidate division KSB1 bacterium]|nr:aldo/keto reductase [candidate division KSB1 bacterium]RQW01354.1 MAG: aldo/keto reductase [candidate division KSB1 bacterium]